MSGRRKSTPEASLAARALEKDEDLREGGLSALIERHGEARIVRVRDATGSDVLTASRFPAAEEPSPAYPDWIPFIPGVGCMLTDAPAQRMLVYHVFSRPLDWLRQMAARFSELIEGLGLPDPDTFKRPDGTIDQDAMVAYLRANETEIPAEVVAEVNALWSDAGAEAGALERAWDRFVAWHTERGWSVEEREPDGPLVRSCALDHDSERRVAMATSMIGTQQILVSFGEAVAAPAGPR